MSTASAPAERRPTATVKDLNEFLQRHIGSIQAVAAKAINPDRMVRIVIAAATRTPLLVKCDPLTVLRSCAKAAELGLEIEGGLGEAYLVPYWNKKRSTYEAQCIPGYRGLIKLARRSGDIAKVEAHTVHERDQFEFEHGTSERLIHRPELGDEDQRGPIVAFYALAVLRDGTKQFEVMSKQQVDGIRGRSAAGDAGPWVTDYAEMGRKTTVRRLSKYLPMSVELADALALQAHAEAGDFDPGAIEHVPTTPVPRAKAEPATQQEPAAELPEPNPAEQKPADEPPPPAAATAKPGKKISAGLARTLRNALASRKVAEADLLKAFSIEHLEDLAESLVDDATVWISDAAKGSK